jgi:hypothetical protein
MGEPVAVVAHRVGEDLGGEPVVLAGADVARAQVLHLPRRRHRHRSPGVEQRLEHRPVRAFDPDPGQNELGQPGRQPGQAGAAMADRVPPQHRAGGVDDADGVVSTVESCMCTCWLLPQRASTRWSRDVHADRSLIGAHGAQPCCPSARPGPPDPAELSLAVTSSKRPWQ